MLEEALGYILFGAIGTYFYIVFLTANQSIKNWLNENDFELVSKEFRLFRTGPYWETANRPVYKLVVKPPSGEMKTCWVRCNSRFGFDPSHFEVQFEG